MEDLGRAVELQLHPPSRFGLIIYSAIALGLVSSSLWSFLTHHEVIGGFFLLLLAVAFWRVLRTRSISVNSEGIRVTFKYTGKTQLFRWKEISKVEVSGLGKDADDMDFCNHVTFVTDQGKVIRTNDHSARNYGEFVAAVQTHLAAENQKRELDVVIKRCTGVKHNGAD